MLYVNAAFNNLVGYDAYGCIAWTWYLAADMWMFIVSPLVVVPLWMSKVRGLAWAGFILAAQTALVMYYPTVDNPLDHQGWPSYTYTCHTVLYIGIVYVDCTMIKFEY